MYNGGKINTYKIVISLQTKIVIFLSPFGFYFIFAL